MKKIYFLFIILPQILFGQSEEVTEVRMINQDLGKYDFHCTVTNRSDKPILVRFSLNEIWKDASGGSSVQLFLLQGVTLADGEKNAILNPINRTYELMINPSSDIRVILSMACMNKYFLAYNGDPKQLKRTHTRYTLPGEPRQEIEAARPCYPTQSTKMEASRPMDLQLFKELFENLVWQQIRFNCPNQAANDAIVDALVKQVPRLPVHSRPFDLSSHEEFAPNAPKITFKNILWEEKEGHYYIHANLCFETPTDAEITRIITQWKTFCSQLTTAEK